MTHALASSESTSTRRFAESDLPTRFGSFRVVIYRTGGDEALAMIHGDVAGREGVLVRVHSECLTGEVMGSLRCDCRAQLDLALQRIAAEDGVLIYLRQEGRGIGLGNKIRAYALQDDGHDTVEANLALGFAADDREYGVAAEILADLGVTDVRLMTNNPLKADQLAAAGVGVAVEPHWTPAGEKAADYLETKRVKLGHTGKPVTGKKAKLP